MSNIFVEKYNNFCKKWHFKTHSGSRRKSSTSPLRLAPSYWRFFLSFILSLFPSFSLLFNCQFLLLLHQSYFKHHYWQLSFSSSAVNPGCSPCLIYYLYRLCQGRDAQCPPWSQSFLSWRLGWVNRIRQLLPRQMLFAVGLILSLWLLLSFIHSFCLSFNINFFYHACYINHTSSAVSGSVLSLLAPLALAALLI